MLRILTLIAIISMALAPAPAAALDPELDRPYRVQVVLRVAPHRLLTPVFQDQLRREIRESLQGALGAMGRVEVVADHPNLAEIEAKGLQQALDGWRDVSEVKTHFVLVDFVDGQYQVQARQHDGLTGLSSPAGRVVRTADRLFVARTACLMIQRDFGPVGTLDMSTFNGRMVAITLKAAGLGAMERWVGRDDVFMLAQIGGSGERQHGSLIPAAFLQVAEVPREGRCRCRLYHRYENPLSPGGEYRCLKLGTQKGPLRLRFLDDDGRPQSGLTVIVGGTGYPTAKDFQAQGATGADGSYHNEKQVYDHLAFVVVQSGAAPVAQFPVPIVDDSLHVVRIQVDPRAEALGVLDFRRKRWVSHVYQSLQVQDELRREVRELMGRSENDRALEKARASFALLQKDLAQLSDAMQTLRASAGGARLPPGTTLNLDTGEKGLQQLRDWEPRLKETVDNLEEVFRKENDPVRKEIRGLAEQGRLLEEEAEFDQAIARYEKALALAGTEPPAELVKRLQTLKQAWAVKDAEHAAARDFIYRTWSAANSFARVQEHIDRAQQALATCRQAGDRLAPLKLFRVNVTLHTVLERERASLRLQDEDSREKAKKIVELLDQLERFSKEINDYLKPV